MNTLAKIGAGVLVTAGVLVMHANAQQSSLTDAEFVYRASEAGIIEVSMGRTALEYSKSSDVQRFALAMISAHDKANDELKILARQKGMTVVDEAAAREKAQAIADGLDKENFDSDYAIGQVKAHEEMVELFNAAASELPDSELQNYAREKLPTLEQHLTLARELVQLKQQ